MARGTTLGELVTKLRISARYDPNPAMSKNMVPLFQQLLQDTQERLYDQFDWPFLKVQRDVLLGAGQRYCDVPTDMNLERIVAVDVSIGGIWQPVERGITLNDYSSCNSDLDGRRDPVLRWDVRDTGEKEQVEVWPIPASSAVQLRFSGYRKLKPLVNEADRADLDDQLIVCFASAEALAGRNDNEAQLKLQQGGNRLKLLQGRVTRTRRGGFVLGGGPLAEERRGYPSGVTVVGQSSAVIDDPGDLAGMLG